MISISVIVPVYNVAEYLNRCLDSLVSQTFSDFEVILVNDGSTDNSLAICESYVEAYQHIFKVYSKVNGGLSDARNFGIKKAIGTYVAFIDSDDWIDLDMLKSMYAKAIDTNADIVACDLEYHHQDGKIAFSSGGDFDTVVIKNTPEIIKINNSACNKLYKKTLFTDIEFPIGLWYEDLATIPRVILKAKIITKVNHPFYKYFQRSGSIMHSGSEKIFDIYKCIDITYAYIKEKCEPQMQQQLKPYIDELYLIHGLQLTTLRIREFKEDRVSYLERNVKEISLRVFNWYKEILRYDHNFKNRIVYMLLYYRRFKMLLWFYDLVK